ncbi:MAG: hypothetical protein H0T46_36955 [Deltaproteobacteria bacterium]|nr:hypothetical protein [Deltaproteobacteria bacterium]
MDIRFGDHSSFHKAAVGMVGGSLLLGLALHPVTPMAPLAGGILGIAAGAAFAHGKAAWRIAAAGAAVIPLMVMTPSWPLLAGVASVLALGLSIGGPRGVKGALGVGLAAVTALVAMWCALRIDGAKQTSSWPLVVKTMASAAAMGMVGVLAMLPRHLKLALDPIQAALKKVSGTLDPEVQNLCDRSVAIWNSTKDRLADSDPGKNLVRDGVLKTIEVAAKSAEVKLTGANDAELAARMEELDKRIAAATDAEVKTQYTAARAALDDQRRYRAQIRQGRERVVARMHNHVAALEKFQLAATGLEASRVAASGVGKQLDELSQEVAASGEALAEMELGVSATPSDTEAKPAIAQA